MRFPPFLYWQILIEFCAGGAVDAVMLGKSTQPSSLDSKVDTLNWMKHFWNVQPLAIFHESESLCLPLFSLQNWKDHWQSLRSGWFVSRLCRPSSTSMRTISSTETWRLATSSWQWTGMSSLVCKMLFVDIKTYIFCGPFSLPFGTVCDYVTQEMKYEWYINHIWSLM